MATSDQPVHEPIPEATAESSDPAESPRSWDRSALTVVVGLCALKAVVHLLVAARYGYHGDELYFLECGRHLAFGYVDHPPLIPWIARIVEVLGGGLVALRLPAIAAGVGTLLVTALLVRHWRGGAWAQALALLCLLFAPAHLRLSAMLNIPVVEVFLCTLAAYLVTRAVADTRCTQGRARWLLAGLVLGLAILAKHSSVLWAVALFVGLVATASGRRALRTPWPWVGGCVALLLALPNLWWQLDHGFATLEFLRGLRHDVLVHQGRGLFAAGQLLYFHPLAVPVWIAGIGFAFRRLGRSQRPFALAFLVLFTFYLAFGGKPYYLASAYPAVLAAGAVSLERRWATRPGRRKLFVGSLSATGVVLGLLTLPLLPIQTLDRVIGAALGWVVPPIALTHDLHSMLDWPEHVAVIERVIGSLPEADHDKVALVVGKYSQASALNVLGGSGLPRASSGHMTFFLWRFEPGRGDILVAYGLPLPWLERHYGDCREAARIEAPLAGPEETSLPVFLCRDPRHSLEESWPGLRNFRHGPG